MPENTSSPPATAVSASSRALRVTAVRFDGHNADEVQNLCASYAAQLGYGAVPSSGLELVMDQPFAKVFDIRSGVWRLVPVGAWVVLDGTGALVLDAVWFAALFGDAGEAESEHISALAEISGRVSRDVEQMRWIAERIDLHVVGRQVDDDVYADGPWLPGPVPAPVPDRLSAQWLRPVADPSARNWAA